MDELARDLRFALRSLLKRPALFGIATLSLALGISANTTVFAAIDGFMLHQLPYPDAGRILQLWTTNASRGWTRATTSMPDYLDWRRDARSMEIAAYTGGSFNLADGDRPERVPGVRVTPSFFTVMGTPPLYGRAFLPEEELPGTAKAIVIGNALWKRRFAGDPRALGRVIKLNGEPYTIVGIMPETFKFPSLNTDIWTPLTHDGTEKRANRGLAVVGHVRRGVSRERADQELATIATRLAGQFEEDRGESVSTETIQHSMLGDEFNRGAAISTVAVVFVLLIACANVANLLLARALKRRREIAVRIALGVSRGRLLMQLVTESLLLAALGGVAGLAIAQWGGTLMRRTLLDQASEGPTAFTDPRLLGFAALLAVVAGLLTGLAPALQTGRQDVAAALKSGSREGTVHRSRLRAALLIGQAALSVVLLMGAGLFLRSLVNVQNIRMGYDADRVMWVELNLRGVESDSVQKVQLRQHLLERAAQIPGVEHATRALTVPFWSTWQFSLFVPGIDSVGKLGDFTLQAATPDFFATMGTRILRGRAFTAEDREHAPRVMVVGESMAKKIWPGKDAIGQCIKVSADTMPCTTVIGIAEDIHSGSMSETEAHYYMPIDQFRPAEGGLFVRTAGHAADHADAVRRTLQQVMPGVSYVTVTPMSTIIAPEIRSWKVGAIMFAVFGALALVLAAIGLYSVIAYNVTQRTHEMGVRVALGAQARDVIRLIVREGLRVVIPGVVLGAVIALVAGKWIAPLLFNVSPKDPPVLATVVVTLIAVAILASWLPATRAARVDPNEALRAD